MTGCSADERNRGSSPAPETLFGDAVAISCEPGPPRISCPGRALAGKSLVPAPIEAVVDAGFDHLDVAAQGQAVARNGWSGRRPVVQPDPVVFDLRRPLR